MKALCSRYPSRGGAGQQNFQIQVPSWDCTSRSIFWDGLSGSAGPGGDHASGRRTVFDGVSLYRDGVSSLDLPGQSGDRRRRSGRAGAFDSLFHQESPRSNTLFLKHKKPGRAGWSWRAPNFGSPFDTCLKHALGKGVQVATRTWSLFRSENTR